MAILLNDSIRVQGGKPAEDKRLNHGVPYTSVGQVNSLIHPTDRYISLEVLINDKIYWYKGGVEDSHLVEKQDGFSGDWDDLSGKPTSFPSDWNTTANKPDLSVYEKTADVTTKLANKLDVTKKITNFTITGDVTKTATLTLADGTTFVSTFNDLDTKLQDISLNTLSFDKDTGILKGLKTDNTPVSAPIDGRYSLLDHTHNWDSISGKPAVVGDMQKSVYDTNDNGIVDRAERLRYIEVTVNSDKALVAKVGTTTSGNYVPQKGDELLVDFVQGSTSSSSSLNIDGSGAKPIRIGGRLASWTTLNVNSATGGVGRLVRLFYDGESYQMYGSLANHVYPELSVAQVSDPNNATVGIVSGKILSSLRAMVGGRNYIRRYRKFLAGTSANGVISSITPEGYLKVVANAGNSNYLTNFLTAGALNLVEENFNEGEPFTFSMLIKKTEGTPTNTPTVYIKSSLGYRQTKPARNYVDGEWNQVYFTANWSKVDGISLHFGFSGAIGTWLISAVQIEKGNTPSDIRPAIEDLIVENKQLFKIYSNITTSQSLEGFEQNGKTVVSMGTSNIIVTIDSDEGFVGAYQKGSTGNIIFQAGAGKNLIQIDGVNVIDGARGSTATATILGNDILLRVSNV